MSRFFNPQLLTRFVRAKAEDLNNNLGAIDAGFAAVAAELDETIPVLNETTMTQIGWTAPTLSAGEEFQMVAIPDAGLVYPADLADNFGCLRGTAPASDFVIAIRHHRADGTLAGQIGTITIKPDRSIVRATTGHAPITLPGGGALVFAGPAAAQTVTYFAERMVPNL
jgi:hypothetical protein